MVTCRGSYPTLETTTLLTQFRQIPRDYPYHGDDVSGLLAGKGLVIAAGRATLVNGVISVEDVDDVGPTSIIVISSMSEGVTGNLRAVNVINGVGFDIISTNLGDNGEVAWIMI